MAERYRYDYAGIFCDHSGKKTEALMNASGHTRLENLVYHSTSRMPGLSVFEFAPTRPLLLKERMKQSNLCMLSFCLGDSIEWSLEEMEGTVLSLDRNECCIMTGTTNQCISRYEAGRHYFGVGIGFDPSRLQGVAECLQQENAVNCLNNLSGGLKHYVITPHAAGILSQIIDCKICDGLKPMYLEGKILELLAVFLNEIIYQRSDKLPELSLSKEDRFALNRAKEILDKTFVHPLTISQLSRKVYLNEFKLKTGFKQCFGQTIYSYVLDKRMELAHILIGQKRFKVGDIAGLVGYSNVSHFIAAFNKKYGITPGKFSENMQKAQIIH